MTGTSATLASNTDCIMVQEVEAFTVTANGQTAFTLAFIPSGDVVMQVNGSGRMHSITAVGVNATYTPAINGGYVLQTGDEVEVVYARMVCVGDPPAAEVCPGPMTRLELIAMRNAGGLSKDCDYVVTDHVQGRLVAGTTIHLQAVSATQLSENVSVQSTYDNEAWAGIYDIDRALVLELTDNRGNRAKGINGLQVANFDWGNASYTNVVVDNGTLTADVGNVVTKTNITVRHGGNFNISGTTAAYIGNVTVERAGNFSLVNANGNWAEVFVAENSFLNLANYTGGGIQRSITLLGGSQINLSNRTAAVTLDRVNFSVFTVNASGVTTGTLSLSFSYNLSGGVINQLEGSGNATISRTEVLSQASISANGGGGALTVDSCRVSGSASVSRNSSGLLSMSRCLVDGNAICYNSSTGTMLVSSTKVLTNSSLYLEAGSTIGGTFSSLIIEHSSSVRTVGAVVAGVFTVSNSRLFANGYIYMRAAYSGSATVNLSSANSSSGIDFSSGDRSYTMTRVDLDEASRCVLFGTGAVTDTVTDLNITTRGSLILSATGAANALNYNSINGLNGILSVSGSTGSQVIERCKLYDGTITVHNCPLNLGLVMCTVRDFGRILIQDMAVAKTVQYCEVSQRGSLLLTAVTGGGTLNYVNVSGFATFNETGVAGSATRVTVLAGTVNHNGGTIDTLLKGGLGTLTTGNFAHSNIVHMSSVNTTLTAANANSALYQGLAAGAYTATGQLV